VISRSREKTDGQVICPPASGMPVRGETDRVRARSPVAQDDPIHERIREYIFALSGAGGTWKFLCQLDTYKREDQSDPRAELVDVVVLPGGRRGFTVVYRVENRRAYMEKIAALDALLRRENLVESGSPGVESVSGERICLTWRLIPSVDARVEVQ
jgi:hypothetical protein